MIGLKSAASAALPAGVGFLKGAFANFARTISERLDTLCKPKKIQQREPSSEALLGPRDNAGGLQTLTAELEKSS